MYIYCIYTVVGGKKVRVEAKGPYLGDFLSEEDAENARRKLKNPDSCWVESEYCMP